MGDETQDTGIPMAEPTTTAAVAPGVLYEHYCEEPGCEKWGGWGFGVGKAVPKWWCYEHYPYRDMHKRSQAGDAGSPNGTAVTA